ncbi:MAG: ribosome small subunit-dependent GTPase A [Phenylobacterium sp.]
MLNSYGWSAKLQHDFEPYAAEGLSPGRVIVQQRGLYRLVTATGELNARLSGRFVHEAAEGDHPVVGDWVAADLRLEEGQATIQAVLPRASAFVRRAAGPSGAAQVVAANVDVALLAASLNAELNPRRLERYLATAYESGAQPVILLTKADACEDAEALIEGVRAVARGVPVVAISARTGQGLDELAAHLTPGRTAVLLGSSGVGKSTLVNVLFGAEKMATREIREDDAHGRHTTTHRELVLLPSGALILDTPGMRELGLWEVQQGVEATFADLRAEIETLAEGCKFRDCAHGNEPGCAVRAALEDGRLDAERYAAWGKLQRELAHEVRKEDPRARAQARKVWISRTKGVRSMMRQKKKEQEE